MTNEHIQTLSTILRAMALNYGAGHYWDHLDGEAVTKAADGIDSLLAEREADKALIAEQAKRVTELREWNAGLAQESLNRQQRIAELVHDHRVHAARLIDERGRLKERIAELEREKEAMTAAALAMREARTLTVDLRKHSVDEVMIISQMDREYSEGWCSANDWAIHKVREACAAAGITLVVGGEDAQG